LYSGAQLRNLGAPCAYASNGAKGAGPRLPGDENGSGARPRSKSSLAVALLKVAAAE
jgi:hypothetical protein